jgi:4-hydroxybutyrate CoA-transferase
MEKGKYSNAREALRQAIRPGDRIFFSIASAQPQTLLRAMAADFDYYKGVEVISSTLLADHPLAKKGLESAFRCVSLQLGASTRKDWEEGRIDFLPVRISDMPAFFGPAGPAPVQVVLVQASPPDAGGRYSVGASACMAFPLAKNARTIVAEVNDQAPQTFGPSSFSASEIDFLVKCSSPLIPYPEIRIGEAERRIAKIVAALIPDGATIQLGIGNLPAAILQLLEGKKDLGVHSGMISDGVVDLMEKGVINNRKKKIFPGKTIAGELIGSEKLFRFAHQNPDVEMHSSAVTHNAHLISQLDQFVAINSAVEIDLTGQINAESVDGVQISGVGGQCDFVEGALHSRGGRAITAMTATAGKGKISRIVPRLDRGATVTTARYLTDTVVTEYGAAELRGKSYKQRAEALIAIAHPDFRDKLWEEFRRGLARKSKGP